MPGEITALISGLCYALSYLYLNRAQKRGQTSDNGLLPVLVISGSVLVVAYLIRLLWGPSSTTWEHRTAEQGAFEQGAFEQGWRHAAVFCILAGITWNFLGRMTLYAAIVRIGATRGVVLKAVAPVVTLLFAVVFLQEPLGLWDVLGFLLMTISITLLVFERRLLHRGSARTVVTHGILLGLASAVLQGTGHILRKVSLNFLSPSLGAALDMAAAAGAYVIYLAVVGRLHYHVRFYLRHRSVDVMMAAVLSIVGSLTFFVASANAPISNVAIILGMQPIFMPFLSSIVFRGFEQFTWLSYLSGVLVVSGVILMILGSSP